MPGNRFTLDKPGPLGLQHTANYYGNCMFGGLLACGVTHASVVTLDVAKCRSQAHAKSGKWPGGLVGSISKSYKMEGVRGITKGWVPTFFGYGAQGVCKFGLNEVFKDVYGNLMGKDNVENNKALRMFLWAIASGSAEVFADVALCPFEMTKVKMQVSLPGEKGGVSPSLLKAMGQLNKNPLKAETGFPFGSLQPLWGRQIPYTMIKFVGFYLTAETVYDQIYKRTGNKKEDLSDFTQLTITFACGYWAGIFCAITTQPMDNLVSMKGNPIYKDASWGEMAREMGTKNLFTQGLVTRIIMIGTLTGLQWWIYGSWKNVCGFGTQ
jgi:solute carrier family 25 phosphate transporter 3